MNCGKLGCSLCIKLRHHNPNIGENLYGDVEQVTIKKNDF